jgi:hypothetical protein
MSNIHNDKSTVLTARLGFCVNIPEKLNIVRCRYIAASCIHYHNEARYTRYHAVMNNVQNKIITHCTEHCDVKHNVITFDLYKPKIRARYGVHCPA